MYLIKFNGYNKYSQTKPTLAKVTRLCSPVCVIFTVQEDKFWKFTFFLMYLVYKRSINKNYTWFFVLYECIRLYEYTTLQPHLSIKKLLQWKKEIKTLYMLISIFRFIKTSCTILLNKIYDFLSIVQICFEIIG